MLIILSNTICSSNSIIAHSTRINAERAISISFILTHHAMIEMLTLDRLLLPTKPIHGCSASLRLMPGITLSHIFHEITIEHCLTHLLLIISVLLHIRVLLSISTESSHSGLVERLLFLVHLIHIGKHFMDSGIVC